MKRRNVSPVGRVARGFTLLEMVIATSMFLVISAAIFVLLQNAQFRLMGEESVVPVLQESRVAMDLIVRDVHRAGFPSPFEFPATPTDPTTAPAALQAQFSLGFKALPNQVCVINTNCALPNGFELLVESTPPLSNNVQCIEYQLVRNAGQATSTLMRSEAPKDAATLCGGGAQQNWSAILENILNDPANPADAIFTYPCPSGVCPTADKLQQVQINLRIRSYRPDPQMNQYRQLSVVELAQRLNPTP